jgi:ParB/RepB/Spo0J family partition protein
MAELKNVAIGLVQENPEAIRVVNRQSESFLGIVDSIRSKGFLGTVTVRPVSIEGVTNYIVVDGMHRFLAAKDAGLTEIPCNIASLSEAEAIEYSIMGNVHRVDTKPSEYRVGILKLLQMNPMMTESELAAKLDKSTAWVANTLRLNKIDNAEIIALVDSGEIGLSNAYALAKLPADEQVNFLTDAQTMAPDEFIPRVAERVNEIKDAKRKGLDPNAAAFIPAEYMQKMSEIRAQRDSGDVGRALIAETGVTTAQQGFDLALQWVLHADVFSVHEQKAKWDAKEAIKAEKAAKLKAEKAAKAKQKAQEALDKAAAIEAGIAG